MWTTSWVSMCLFTLMISTPIFFLSGFEESMLISFEISSSFELTFLLDKISSIFLFMLSWVSMVILFYSQKYMSVEKEKKKFIWVLLLFVLSMVFLSLSGDLFTMMVGWDGLGISSFCLIIYFHSWSSMKGGLTTFVSNRIGDIFLIFAISLWSVSGEMPHEASWFILLGALTKSAQIPFSAWLPLAMAAPTPVSSLVHSSTLVTAGVFLVIRFFECFSSSEMLVLSLLSGSSVLMAGSSALSEMDLKKVIALSTLSHISLMMVFLSVGWVESAMCHMLMHAFFKSLLFMGAGEVIHMFNSSQDLRSMSVTGSPHSIRFSLTISLISMMGSPFLSGFFSKELFLGITSSEGRVLLVGVFYAGAILTVAYSVRVLWMMWFSASFSPLFCESAESDLLSFWSLFSIFGWGMLFTFLPLSSTSPSSLWSGSIPLLFFLGGIVGVFTTKKLPHIPSWSVGGKMWGVHPFSIFSWTFLRKSSFFSMNYLDYMGLSSKVSKLSELSISSLLEKESNFMTLVSLTSSLVLVSLFIR